MKLLKRIKFFIQTLLFKFFNFKKGVSLGKNIRIKGFPIIFLDNSGSILIEKNVLLNSSNFGYHINMHSPVKLMADRPNAIIIIGENSRIHGSCIHAYKRIRIGKNCLVAANTQIIDGNGHDLCLDNPSQRINTIGEAKEINIEDNVWIGANCIILPGVTIGEGSVIAACSVVAKDIPPRCVAAGNPAKIVKLLNS